MTSSHQRRPQHFRDHTRSNPLSKIFAGGVPCKNCLRRLRAFFVTSPRHGADGRGGGLRVGVWGWVRQAPEEPPGRPPRGGGSGATDASAASGVPPVHGSAHGGCRGGRRRLDAMICKLHWRPLFRGAALAFFAHCAVRASVNTQLGLRHGPAPPTTPHPATPPLSRTR